MHKNKEKCEKFKIHILKHESRKAKMNNGKKMGIRKIDVCTGSTQGIPN